MRALITCVIILLALNIHAQEYFSATGVEVGDSDHLAFMSKYKSEIQKRADIWKVPAEAVQVIASVQSGGGILEGFNYGAVLPAPAITKYPKFSKTDDFDLVACSKPSRGFEVIAIALNAMRQESGLELNTAQDFLNHLFGAGGELSIMASEAEKAYTAYTGEYLSISPSYSAPATTPSENTSSETTSTPNLMVEPKVEQETISEEVITETIENSEVLEPAVDSEVEIEEKATEVVETNAPEIETEVEVVQQIEEVAEEAKPVEEKTKENTVAPRPEKKSSGIVTYSDALNSIEAKKEEEKREASGKTIFVAEEIEETSPSAPKEKERGIAEIETYQSTGVIRKEKEKKTDIEALLAEYRSEGHSEEDVAKYKERLEEEDRLMQSKLKQQALREEAKKEEAERAAQIERAEKIIMEQREAARKAREQKEKEGGN